MALAKKLDALREPTPWPALQNFAAESRAQFSTAQQSRLTLVVQRDGALLSKLVDAVRAKLHAEPDARYWKLPEGAYYGQGPSAGKLAVLFPGQGSQYVGMARDLACTFPAMRKVLADANRVFARMNGDPGAERLSDVIYPFPAFSAGERDEQDRRLRTTEIAQPAIGAVSLGALKVLEQFGIKPDAYAGHSYGELPALCAAGCFDDEQLHSISRLRGHLMASYHGSDAGGMLAVHASSSAIQSVLSEETLDLVVANRNAPMQSVLSGRMEEIDRAMVCLDRRQLRHTRLPVAAAFHSKLVSSAESPFRSALKEVEFQPASREVFANTSGRLYPRSPNEIRELLAGQLANPVQFVEQIRGMAEGGVRTFLEVGPGSTLSKLVQSILGAADSPQPFSEWDTGALDASTGKRSGNFDLAQVSARLAARGHDINLAKWEEGRAASIPHSAAGKKGLVVPICGANYVAPKPKKARETKIVEKHTNINVVPVVKAAARSVAPAPIAALSPTPSRHMQQISHPRGAATSPSVVDALQITQQSLAAFQQLQEQTAQLHRQFLESQEAAQRTLQMLVEQQHALLVGGTARPLTFAPSPRPAPAPIAPSEPAPPAPNRNGSANGEYHRAEPAPAKAAPIKPVAKVASIDFQGALLAVVAEKTGYPADMLQPEMALDADLGIDSIKRVEIFSALQEKLPQAPIVKPEHLGSLQTLGDVIAFLSAGQPTAAAQMVAKKAAPEAVDVGSILFAVVAEKTGYPSEMLNAEMALDADLGIDSIKRVEIFSALQERLPEAPIVKPEHLGTLHSLGDVIAFLSDVGTSARAEPAKKKLVRPVESLPAEDAVILERRVLRAKPLGDQANAKIVELPVGGPVVLVGELSATTTAFKQQIEQNGQRVQHFSWQDAVQVIDGTCGLILLAPDNQIDDLALCAFRWLRVCSAPLRSAAERGGALLATLTQFDGSFGLRSLATGCDMTAGALAGLVKTARLEWPGVVCKAIDLDPAFPVERFAEVWSSILQNGPVEVGISAKGKVSCELIDEPIAAGGAPFSQSDVVVISGGARGVTAAVAQAIAEHYQPTLILLGRTDLDVTEPAWLNEHKTEAAIKQALARQTKPALSPKALNAECRQILARRESLANIERMKEAGSRVFYRSLDVNDAAAVKSALADLTPTTGQVTHLVHGAGLLADRRIEDLTDEQFSQVYQTKVAGFHSLLAATNQVQLKAIVLFSSSTARFGRVGQASYAAANESLNKLAQAQARLRPNTKVVAVNWGPWDGGMVTPALRDLFASEGVGVIPLRQGAELLLRELQAEKSAVEVVVIAKPAVAQAVPSAALSIAFEQEVSVANYPILRSHVIDGRAVLPLALHLELMAHAALHGNPGLLFHGTNNLRVFNGVYAEADSALQVFAGKSAKQESAFLVPIELRSRKGAREIVHSRAEVVMMQRLLAPGRAEPMEGLRPYPHSIDDCYRRLLFHGRELAAIDTVEGYSENSISGISRAASAPSEWMKQPLRGNWIADPQVIDSAFQLMILWSFAKHGAGCLPCFVGQYRQYRRAFPTDFVRIQIRIKHETAALVRADIDFLDSDGSLIARMNDHESVIDAKLNAAFRNNRLADAGGVL